MTSKPLELQLINFQNEESVTIHREALGRLKNLGIMEFLRLKGAPRTIDDGRNASANAYEGGRAAGYAECLEDLEYFAQKFINLQPMTSIPAPTFGARKRLLESGEYSEAEINEFERTGQLPNGKSASE